MADDLPLSREGPRAGVLERVAPLVRRLVAPNPSPFTFTGTCAYVVGEGRVSVIDPGPVSEPHLDALLAGLGGERVEAILVTHTHRDHSPGAAALKARTGAPIWGCGPHRAARPMAEGEAKRLDASADPDFAPDWVMADGAVMEGAGYALEAVATPGHTMNHLAFALHAPGERTLFSGDHVMAWSTTIVAPPDGAMGAYMASLDKLKGRAETVYWPGHGGPVREPARFLRALAHHRRGREAGILARLAAGDRRIAEMVPRLYEGLNPALHGAAALSILAHLEDLAERGLVRVEGEGVGAVFAPA